MYICTVEHTATTYFFTLLCFPRRVIVLVPRQFNYPPVEAAFVNTARLANWYLTPLSVDFAGVPLLGDAAIDSIFHSLPFLVVCIYRGSRDVSRDSFTVNKSTEQPFVSSLPLISPSPLHASKKCGRLVILVLQTTLSPRASVKGNHPRSKLGTLHYQMKRDGSWNESVSFLFIAAIESRPLPVARFVLPLSLAVVSVLSCLGTSRPRIRIIGWHARFGR